MSNKYQKIESIHTIDFIDTNRRTNEKYTFPSGTINNAKLLATLTDTALNTIGPGTEVIVPSLTLGEEKDVYLKIQPLLRFGTPSNEYAYTLLAKTLHLHVNSTAMIELPSTLQQIKLGNSTSQTIVVPMHRKSIIGSDRIEYEGIGTAQGASTHFAVTFERQLKSGNVSAASFAVNKDDLNIGMAHFESVEIGDFTSSSTDDLLWQTPTNMTITRPSNNDSPSRFNVTIENIPLDNDDYDTEYAFRWKNVHDPNGTFSEVTIIRIFHHEVVKDYVEFISPDDNQPFVGTPVVKVNLGKIGKEEPEIEQ